MRDFKSTGYEFVPIIIWLFSVYEFSDKFKSFHKILDNIEYLVLSLFIVIVVTINVITVNRDEIIKKLYFIPIILKRRTWREIKFYVEVDEIYYGQYGKSKVAAIWFVDYNGRVCFRFKKKYRGNLETLLNTIDKYETKHSNQITITNPVFMRKGLTKFKDPKSENKLKNDQENKAN
jgi:uncharacterized membrane protein